MEVNSRDDFVKWLNDQIEWFETDDCHQVPSGVHVILGVLF